MQSGIPIDKMEGEAVNRHDAKHLQPGKGKNRKAGG